uniref:Uncharacterized protein n=1 Tax=Anopheles coluzzii TaxID=1518534 RepID=A0A8W7Q1A7_ANOCL
MLKLFFEELELAELVTLVFSSLPLDSGSGIGCRNSTIVGNSTRWWNKSPSRIKGTFPSTRIFSLTTVGMVVRLLSWLSVLWIPSVRRPAVISAARSPANISRVVGRCPIG